MSWARRVLLIFALAFPAVYVAIALRRMRYPFDLEWFEGAILHSTVRVLAGEPVYAAPSVEYVPMLYTPLYYYVGALSSALVGPGLPALRLVSFLASLACFALLFSIVRRETRSAWTAAIGVGLFAATYREVGSWFDVARIDSLFLALLLGAVGVLQARRSRAWWCFAGGLLALAFLTKQTTLPISLPLLIACLAIDWRCGLWLAGTFAAGVLTSTWWLDGTSEGWYSRYVFDLPYRAYGRVDARILSYWTRDLLRPLPVACVAATAFAVLGSRARIAARRAGTPWLELLRADGFVLLVALAVGTVGACWGQRVHKGGAFNVLIPVYATIAVLAALALHRALGHGSVRVRAAALAIALGQLALLVYDPTRALPRAGDEDAGRRLVERVRRIEGPVFLPYHPEVAALAGKPRFAHGGAAGWLMDARGSDAAERLHGLFDRAFASRRFAAVISDAEGFPSWFSSFGQSYRAREKVFEDPEAFFQVTGVRSRPEILFLPDR